MSMAASIIIAEHDLPIDLSAAEAVSAAYPTELQTTAQDLLRGLPVLLECDKDLAPFVFVDLRSRLKGHGVRCLYLDGRPRGDDPAALDMGFLTQMVCQLKSAVRGVVDQRVVVLPHLDLLTTSAGGLTSEAREVISLLYENPELVWLGFKDPSFGLPAVIENLFPRRYEMMGTPRDRLRHLVTQREARKFGTGFNPWALYKHVSGMNAVRLRKVLASLDGEDYPADARLAYGQIRSATLGGRLEVPNVDLAADIGGYERVKERLRVEILDVLQAKDCLTDPGDIARLEGLVPRGMIFWGPPGTGKTLFAKAMATAIGAAITIVSGPELKSRWVGESEERLRTLFRRARASAPAIIVFDELDSFASARGTYTGSGVEHSMVNQLLTEMDGFHSDELVFVVGTTNLVEMLDPALLRPGRFEFLLEIPYPATIDRREILRVHDKRMALEMNDDALDFAVRRTRGLVEGTGGGTRFSGDHINALCRAVARIRLREGLKRPTSPADIERALTQWIERPDMTAEEERVVATHEAGHAICAMFCAHAAPIERISIQADTAGALGFVRYQDPRHRYIVTRGELLDHMCVLMGGREAELLLLDDLSIGSAEDLNRATQISRSLVEAFGMGGEDAGVCRYLDDDDTPSRYPAMSPQQQEVLDRRVRELLEQARVRAAGILLEHKDLLGALRDMLLKHKVLDASAIGALTAETGGAT